MLASVHIYPLKGCRAVDLDEAVVEPWGLAGDRRWLLVDADGQFLTQREHPALARLGLRQAIHPEASRLGRGTLAA